MDSRIEIWVDIFNLVKKVFSKIIKKLSNIIKK